MVDKTSIHRLCTSTIYQQLGAAPAISFQPLSIFIHWPSFVAAAVVMHGLLHNAENDPGLELRLCVERHDRPSFDTQPG